MKKIKNIYIHHFYNDYTAGLKFFHNTKNKEIKIDQNGIGVVKCEYNGILFEFIFNPELNDNEDGYHILDFFYAHGQLWDDEKFQNVQFYNNVEDVPIIKRFSELINDKSNWILTIWRTEKLFDTRNDKYIVELESILRILKNQKIITDNYFLKPIPSGSYDNFYYTFTNSMFEWKNIINIHWSLEFKKIFQKLNFDYNLGVSVRAHRRYRTELLNKLSDLNEPFLFLNHTNSLNNVDESSLYYKFVNKKDNINKNLLSGDFDFESIYDIKENKGPGIDLYFRVLNKSKMFLLDESWAWSKADFMSQYLSEKTINLVLANIPFISTHSYPLVFLQKLFNFRPHPFFDQIKTIQGDPDKITEYVKEFLENFDENYELCKSWTDEIHNLFLEKLKNENSLLDLIISDFKDDKEYVNKSLF